MERSYHMAKFDITWFLTAISLTGTVFNIKKKTICFYIWIFGDILWMLYDLHNITYGRAFLNLVQVLMGIWGIITWNKEAGKCKN